MAIDIGSPSGKLGRAQPNMNVTPLVDVVLVLLIIFMVITPMLAKQFWIHMPNKPDNNPVTENDDDNGNHSIVVSVTEKGEIRINREVVPKEKFPTKLRRVLAASQQRTIFFDAQYKVDFGLAIEVMDLARGGGASTIAVLTEELAQ
jgi:biopolymer transport protein TolR